MSPDQPAPEPQTGENPPCTHTVPDPVRSDQTIGTIVGVPDGASPTGTTLKCSQCGVSFEPTQTEPDALVTFEFTGVLLRIKVAGELRPNMAWGAAEMLKKIGDDLYDAIKYERLQAMQQAEEEANRHKRRIVSLDGRPMG